MDVNGVELCVDTRGDPAAPAILLIMGSGASMDWWEDEFCDRLAAGPRFVIRYDHRDTGRSVSYPPGAPGYVGADLVADAVGVLDALELPHAHVVGMSMGGALAQLVALDHADRVGSLTLISTSAGGPGLPGMSQEAAARFAAVEPPDWSDREAVIDYGVELARAAASQSAPFDEVGMRRLWTRALDRTESVESSFRNHDLVAADGDPWRERLAELTVPTLVTHGTEDSVLPFPHGEALAREIPGADLLPLEQTGHELPRRTWDAVIPAILRLTGDISRP
jgi:pimeloyl-ACP methyl ester carboxylesterase